MRSLPKYRSIVTKKVNKGLCVVLQDREDYIAEAEKQLSDKSVYKDANFKSKILQDLAKTSNDIYKKATNLGKIYLLPKIHKRLYDLPGRPVISNCGTSREKVSEFLDKPVILSSYIYPSYLNPSCEKVCLTLKIQTILLHKIRYFKDKPKDALLATADVVGLYPSIQDFKPLSRYQNVERTKRF